MFAREKLRHPGFVPGPQNNSSPYSFMLNEFSKSLGLNLNLLAKEGRRLAVLERRRLVFEQQAELVADELSDRIRIF